MDSERKDEKAQFENSFYNIIDGERVSASKRLSVVNRATGKQLAAVPDVNRVLLNKAISAARNAFAGWNAAPVGRRKTILTPLPNTIGDITFNREKEVDRRTAGVHRPVQVHPFAFHPHVRLVHPPRVIGRLEVPAQAPLQFRSIPLDPSPDGDVIHREPAPDQKLLRMIFKSSWRLFAIAHGTKLGPVPPSVADAKP